MSVLEKVNVQVLNAGGTQASTFKAFQITQDATATPPVVIRAKGNIPLSAGQYFNYLRNYTVYPWSKSVVNGITTFNCYSTVKPVPTVTTPTVAEEVVYPIVYSNLEVRVFTVDIAHTESAVYNWAARPGNDSLVEYGYLGPTGGTVGINLEIREVLSITGSVRKEYVITVPLNAMSDSDLTTHSAGLDKDVQYAFRFQLPGQAKLWTVYSHMQTLYAGDRYVFYCGLAGVDWQFTPAA